jgi:hypothetical protein
MRTKGPAVVALLAALLAICAWLPFLRSVLMPDEAGFLIIAEQFGPGRSLYGDYWVDRPPLIIWMYTLVVPFATVGHVPDGATVPAIKLFGAAIAAVSVLLAFLLARRAAPEHRWTHYAAPVLTLALVSSPLLGMPSTNGELLALPFVLAGLALLVPALVEPHRGRAPMAAFAAGACAMAAVMVKQNFIDVYVFALVAFIVLSVRREQWLRVFLWFVAGSLIALAAIIASAVLRGSSLADLWEAIVTFRFHATSLIGFEIGNSRAERMGVLAAAVVLSGAAALLALTVVMVLTTHGRRHPRTGRLAVPAVAMALWEIVAVVLGGSYWPHYLTGMVPGVVLLVILAGSLERRRSLLTIGVVLATVANAAVWAYRVTDPPQAREDARVAAYLREHSAATDSLLVGFGHPNVYVDAEMRGQYPYMWSLPTRVNDPQLRAAKRVLSGSDAPRWFVVHEDTPVFWDQAAVETRLHVEDAYILRGEIGGWHVWESKAAPLAP